MSEERCARQGCERLKRQHHGAYGRTCGPPEPCYGPPSYVVAIGNLQQWLIGTHHGVSPAQLQVYLDEFVFRHNRRKQPMAAFQTLLGLGTDRKPTPYRLIRGAEDLTSPSAESRPHDMVVC